MKAERERQASKGITEKPQEDFKNEQDRVNSRSIKEMLKKMKKR